MTSLYEFSADELFTRLLNKKKKFTEALTNFKNIFTEYLVFHILCLHTVVFFHFSYRYEIINTNLSIEQLVMNFGQRHLL